jgi:hypothetical protein
MHPRVQQSRISTPTRVLSGFLAAWVFVLSLAGVSPQLHDWLHQDSGCAHSCESHSDENTNEAAPHYCGVVALQGALLDALHLSAPERASHQRAEWYCLSEDSLGSLTDRTHQARAPPLKS